MYTTKNFKSKKELKAAVAAWTDYLANPQNYRDVMLTDVNVEALKPRRPQAVNYYQPGPFGGNEPQNGEFSVEGPHYPQPHKWYARVVARNGMIIKVK